VNGQQSTVNWKNVYRVDASSVPAHDFSAPPRLRGEGLSKQENKSPRGDVPALNFLDWSRLCGEAYSEAVSEGAESDAQQLGGLALPVFLLEGLRSIFFSISASSRQGPLLGGIWMG